MPKIGGWSRVEDRYIRRAVDARKAWVHDDTGEVVAITEKVPDDGYYVMLQAEAPEHWSSFWGGDGERIGYDPTIRYAKRLAARWLRENPDGSRRVVEQ